jgi:hypothetical protein
VLKRPKLTLPLCAVVVALIALLSSWHRTEAQTTPVPTVPSVVNCIAAPSPPPAGILAAVHLVPCTGGGAIPYPAGWSLIAAYSGTDVFYSDGALYTLNLGEAAYEPVPSHTAQGLTWTSLESGSGYWVYFDQPTDVYFPSPPPSHSPLIIQLPPSQFVLIGNPYETPAAIVGADAVYTYRQDSGYSEAAELAVGQGAFAYSLSGGFLTLSPATR